MIKRLSIDAYMMNLARMAASRASCSRRQVGAVMVDSENRVLSTGYNGSPRSLTNCFAAMGGKCGGVGCINTIHAEINALLSCSSKASVIYCTDTPCVNCLKALLSHNPDIRIVHWREYEDPHREWFVDSHEIRNIEKLQNSVLEEMFSVVPPMEGERCE
jgi:dCMP deaminase